MQGQTQDNISHKQAKHIPIALDTNWQECDTCPTALSAYKILCEQHQNCSNPNASNHIDITHQTIATGLNRTPQKSLCALNCLERMGYIKIIKLENQAKGSPSNHIELIYSDNFLKKTA